MIVYIVTYGCPHCEEWEIIEVHSVREKARDRAATLTAERRAKGERCGSYEFEPHVVQA